MPLNVKICQRNISQTVDRIMYLLRQLVTPWMWWHNMGMVEMKNTVDNGMMGHSCGQSGGIKNSGWPPPPLFFWRSCDSPIGIHNAVCKYEYVSHLKRDIYWTHNCTTCPSPTLSVTSTQRTMTNKQLSEAQRSKRKQQPVDQDIVSKLLQDYCQFVKKLICVCFNKQSISEV